MPWDLKKIEAILKNAPSIMAEYAFCTFLGLFFLALVLGAALFYFYGVLPEKKAMVSEEQITRFEEGIYENILAGWEEREQILEASKIKEYTDPFE